MVVKIKKSEKIVYKESEKRFEAINPCGKLSGTKLKRNR